jgi:hypothetical protein
MTKEEFRQHVFLELLRSYHDGINVTHAAEPQDKVGRDNARYEVEFSGGSHVYRRH